jgi:hypothetical protein
MATTHFNYLDSLVLAVLVIDNVRSDGRTRLEIKADGTLPTVTEDLGKEACRPSVGEIG